MEELIDEARSAHAAGRYNEALDALSRAVEEVPSDFDSDLLLWRGRVLNELGRFDEAIGLLEELDQLNRGRGAAGRLERVRSLRGLGNEREAEAVLRGLLRGYPRCGPGRVQLIDLLVEQKRVPEAKSELDALLAQTPGLRWAIALKARLMADGGEMEGALATLRERVDADDEAHSLRTVLIELLLDADRPREAWLESKTLMKESASPEQLELAARAAIAAGEPLDSFAALILALQIEPERESSLDGLLAVLARADELRDGIALQRARAHPERPEGWAQVMRGRIDANGAGEALKLFETLPADVQSDSGLRLLAVEALRGTNDLQRAMEIVVELTPEDPTSTPLGARAWYERGLIEYQRGDLKSASTSFSKGAIGEVAAEAHYNRASIQRELGNYAAAAKALEAATAARPDFDLAWRELGTIYWNFLGDKPRATSAYRKYLELVGSDSDIEALLAQDG